MLMALGGLFANDMVAWMTAMTYQAAPGPGASSMRETGGPDAGSGATAPPPCWTIRQRPFWHWTAGSRQPCVTRAHPKTHFGAPLAASLIPWIDRPHGKAARPRKNEGIRRDQQDPRLQDRPIPIDGQCVRIGSMRCHSQAFTVKLTRDVPLGDIEAMIAGHNPWVRKVPNEKAATLRELSPAAVSGTLDIPVGRIRKLTHRAPNT